ncbi:S9 family peptidase [Steroidobacter sp.]|uniref:S9 family peptidase n=1 Tax=Steroidobacter sp. TaxID=1978227 RepID=UPI001A54AFEE|nr:prolyl oligopeptidase family serine peptidase [Steroidobacter sp.]MBL8267133.1 S9 family peptidase [Steroidobacter sp.]
MSGARLRRRWPVLALMVSTLISATASLASTDSHFTLEQIRSVPYSESLTAAAAAARIAWVSNDRGRRNVWVASAPDYAPRRLTEYNDDDGQALSSVSLSSDGANVVYVRGGDHGANWDESVPVNPSSHPQGGQVAIWSVPYAGGVPRLIGEGDYPTISPEGTRVAFIKEGQAWLAAIDGSTAARRLFAERGQTSDLRWSPDGTRLAFVSKRESHSFVGVYRDDATAISWLAPGVSRDESPRWSPDGKQIAFVRTPGDGGAPPAATPFTIRPWSIWVAEVATGRASRLWQSGAGLRDSWPDAFLDWMGAQHVVFQSYHDGWQHVYAVPRSGGAARLLTPGDYMVESVALSPDRSRLLFSANTGDEPDDIDRRHIYEMSLTMSRPRALTRGVGLEYSPVVSANGAVAFLGATAHRPPRPAIMTPGATAPRWLGAVSSMDERLLSKLVVPSRVQCLAEDGVIVRGQLFQPREQSAKGPAVVHVHGGPRRQMLLGWHSIEYYGNQYAINQYLASQGFTVLALNYRLGIGYGHDLNYPSHAGRNGAAELKDVRAAGKYLQALPRVDAARVGIYGVSYGGYLTSMALAHDSKLFAAGVDIHCVHDWVMIYDMKQPLRTSRYEIPPGTQEAVDLAWRSSPVSSVTTWKSPVLFIHGDDDRNVRFSQTIDLTRRLDTAGVYHETLALPDETHHILRFANELKMNLATVEFLARMLGSPRKLERDDSGRSAP